MKCEDLELKEEFYTPLSCFLKCPVNYDNDESDVPEKGRVHSCVSFWKCSIELILETPGKSRDPFFTRKIRQGNLFLVFTKRENSSRQFLVFPKENDLKQLFTLWNKYYTVTVRRLINATF